MTIPSVPDVNSKISIDISSLLEGETPLVIDDFYTDLDWLKSDSLFNIVRVNDHEQILYPHRDFRIPLLEKVSKLLPDAYYPTDTGWIRSIKSNKGDAPQASIMHADAPYIVISVCLSSPLIGQDSNSLGTQFFKHKDLEFKKITNTKKGQLFKKLYLAQQNDESAWESWFTYPFKKNCAVIYDGALFHKMPWPLEVGTFGDTLLSTRLMQTFSFRLRK
ncbi:MAG: hypothetical protein KC478_11990 [Bacteriovoracaceae bacterium]|nr:hypothetical protein [Bacteriovoracaceae bacterium]